MNYVSRLLCLKFSQIKTQVPQPYLDMKGFFYPVAFSRDISISRPFLTREVSMLRLLKRLKGFSRPFYTVLSMHHVDSGNIRAFRNMT